MVKRFSQHFDYNTLGAHIHFSDQIYVALVCDWSQTLQVLLKRDPTCAWPGRLQPKVLHPYSKKLNANMILPYHIDLKKQTKTKKEQFGIRKNQIITEKLSEKIGKKGRQLEKNLPSVFLTFRLVFPQFLGLSVQLLFKINRLLRDVPRRKKKGYGNMPALIIETCLKCLEPAKTLLNNFPSRRRGSQPKLPHGSW
jgi:hypothetical protein